MQNQLKIAILIPCYNHSKPLYKVVEKLLPLKKHILIVNDGSDLENTRALKRIVTKHKISLLNLDQNQGKGAAVIRGAQLLSKQGFTHILQIDADGQHNLEDAEKMFQLSMKYPKNIVSALPLHDESIPLRRLIGRKITFFWNILETRSLAIKDAFCGFRVYPIDELLKLSEGHIGKRMDFDIEVLVRFYWKKGKIHYVPSKVIYPIDGVSHFDLLKDNLLISKMHARLFFESFFHWR